VLPTLVLDDRAHSLMHPSQAASVLGIPVARAQEAVRLGWDLNTLLEGWMELVSRVPWPVLLETTPSRGRTLLDLVVGSFFRVQFLPAVLDDNVFHWDSKQDRANETTVEAAFGGTDDLVPYLAGIQTRWQRYLADEEGAMSASVRTVIHTLRHGDVEYATLIATVRDHAAQHFRQATTYLAQTNRAVQTDFKLESIRDLRLPVQIY
jgi:hypothetical protein